jgi:ABC-type polysaccharide/polyol phosphate transport system ATPase subunit
MTDAPLRPAVLADDVSKTFRIPKEQVHTLKERALHPLRRTTFNEFGALNGVSFEVPPGEFFGIVGRNGSGKSTLLKCLAGIYRADSGAIYIDGRMSTFIELGVGFNPDLAALDNVTINAAMLGLSRREARRRFDAIIDFAELREFTDLKIKNYSSGMLVRLAFAVMIQVDADILLIDEVLAVGDAAFQQKCFDEFEAIRAAGKTVLLVTHDMGAVRRFCDRAMLLEHGNMVLTGDPDTVGNRYLDLNFSASARARAEAEAAGDAGPEVELGAEGERFGDGRAVIEECWIENGAGERAEILPAGERVTVCARVRFAQDVTDPRFSVMLRNGASLTVFAPSSGWDDPHPGTFHAGEEVLWRASFDLVLAADRYGLTPTVTLGGGAVLAGHERMDSFVVTRPESSGGLVDLPFEQRAERGGPVDVQQEIVR